jgi:excisionase family DNA binding protein
MTYFSVVEVAKLLECTTQNVRAAIKAGRLKAEQKPDGRRDFQISAQELTRYIAAKSHNVQALAKALGYHPEYVRRLLRRHTIPGKKNGQWIVSDVFYWPGKMDK